MQVAESVRRQGRRWPGALGIAVVAIITAWLISGLLVSPADPESVSVGRLHELRQGEPVFHEVRAPFVDHLATWEEEPVERDRAILWVVLHPDQGILALYARDPHRGCRVELLRDFADPDAFVAAGAPAARVRDVVFANPCHAEMYDLAGRAVVGPQPRGLDRFDVRIEDGEVLVDLTSLRRGPGLRESHQAGRAP